MTVDERKKTAEKWSVACNKYDLSLMVQIGGNLPFVEVANLVSTFSQKFFFKIIFKILILRLLMLSP